MSSSSDENTVTTAIDRNDEKDDYVDVDSNVAKEAAARATHKLFLSKQPRTNLTAGKLNLLPCNIAHDGPAPVSTFFTPTKVSSSGLSTLRTFSCSFFML